MTLDDFYSEWRGTTDCVSAHTSGSTGVPKPIQLLKSDMCASAEATIRFFGLDHNSILVCPLSVDYIAGKMMAVRADVCGGRLYMPEASNRFDIPDGVVSLLAIVPSQTNCLIEHPEWVDRVRNIIVGGAELGKEMRARLSALGYNVYESYGMTETCSHVALRHISESTFKAMPGVSFSIDSRGCLVIRTDHLSAKTLVTNDLVTLHSSTAFVWEGRYDNVINSGGIKILPEKLEADISAIMADIPYYICGMEDDKWGSVPVLVCQCTREYGRILLGRIREAILHEYAPKMVITVRTLPKTSNGKIIRKIPAASDWME